MPGDLPGGPSIWSLTELQAQSLFQLFPTHFSIQQVQLPSKRGRIVKKLDDHFETGEQISDKKPRKSNYQLKSVKPILSNLSEPSEEVHESNSQRIDFDSASIDQRHTQGLEDQKTPANDSEVNNQMPKSKHTKQMEKCSLILQKLVNHRASWPFRLPVNPVKQQVPDYFKVIKRPIDLKTIRQKLSNNQYAGAVDFKLDIHRLFMNSYKFNPKDSKYFLLTCELEQYYFDQQEKTGEKYDVKEASKKSATLPTRSISPPPKTVGTKRVKEQQKETDKKQRLHTQNNSKEQAELEEMVKILIAKPHLCLKKVVKLLFPEDQEDSEDEFIVDLQVLDSKQLQAVQEIMDEF